MRGLMMDVPLLVSSILRHAETVHGDAEIASRDADGRAAPLHLRRARVPQPPARPRPRPAGPRAPATASARWPGTAQRHLEVYFAASGSGRVCHTVNPRLFPDQIADIVAHAGDAVLFVDPGLVPLVESLADRLPALRAVVVMASAEAMPRSDAVCPTCCATRS